MKLLENKVAIVTGVPTSSIDLYQMYGFHKAVKDLALNLNVVSQQAAGYDANKAHGIMSSVLQRHPDLCAAFGVWDGQDAGIAAAVTETPATYSSAPEEAEGEATGTLASDEALAALREKLTGEG